MRNPFEFLRMQQMFNPPMGNDLPSQGGITGTMPRGNYPQFPDGGYDYTTAPSMDPLNATMGESENPEQQSLGQPPLNDLFSLPSEESEFDPEKEMMRLYKPEHSASDRLDAILASAPERNKPGIMRRIAASLIGFSGNYGAADKALYAPYYNARDDWKMKLDPAQDAARIENTGNTQMRMIANNILSQRMADARLQRQIKRDETLKGFGEDRSLQGWERVRQGDERLSQGDTRLNQGQQRIDIQRELMNGGQVIKSDDGSMTLVTRDGRRMDVTDDFNNMSFEDKERLKSSLAVDRAAAVTKAREGNKRTRKGMKVTIDEDGNPIYEVVDLDTAKSTPITREGDTTPEPIKAPTTAPVIKQNEADKAERFKAANPTLRKYITIDPKGRVKIQPPGNFMGIGPATGPSEADYKKANQAIFGTSPTANTAPVNKPKVTAPAPGGKVKVRRIADGVSGMMDANDPALKSGKYEVVQ